MMIIMIAVVLKLIQLVATAVIIVATTIISIIYSCYYNMCIYIYI